MLIVLGIGMALFGFYCLSKGLGSDKPLGMGLIGVGMLFCSMGEEKPAGMLLSVVFIIIAVIWALIYRENERNGTNARRRVEELRQIDREYDEAVASQQPGEPWKIVYATEPCPHCGHYKVRNAKWEDKQLSVAFWGVASSKIGKSFKCEHCGEMW